MNKNLTFKQLTDLRKQLCRELKFEHGQLVHKIGQRIAEIDELSSRKTRRAA
jgi:hypothetical protein